MRVAGFSVSTECDVIVGRILLVPIPECIEENRDAPRDEDSSSAMKGVVLNSKAASGTTSSQRFRTRILQDKSESVGAVSESPWLRQLKLKGGLKAGTHRLLLAEPSGARPIALGRRKPQRFARHFGIANQAESLD